MKLKALGLAAAAAMAFTAFAASSASATTLEVGGFTQNQAVTIEASLVAGTSTVTSRTDGSLAHTCTQSTIKGSTVSPFTGTTVTAPLSSMTFTNCTRPFTVHKPGTLHIQHIAGTTDGTVISSETEATKVSIFGTLTCKTGAGTHIGRLTGTASGHARIHINAVLDCGIVPSVTWKGTYTVTSPTGLGVSA